MTYPHYYMDMIKYIKMKKMKICSVCWKKLEYMLWSVEDEELITIWISSVSSKPICFVGMPERIWSSKQ